MKNSHQQASSITSHAVTIGHAQGRVGDHVLHRYLRQMYFHPVHVLCGGSSRPSSGQTMLRIMPPPATAVFYFFSSPIFTILSFELYLYLYLCFIYPFCGRPAVYIWQARIFMDAFHGVHEARYRQEVTELKMVTTKDHIASSDYAQRVRRLSRH